MTKDDKYYDIVYRLKWQKEKSNIIWLMPKEINYHLLQLKRLSASFNWEIIFWIESLDFFQIIEKNYVYIDKWEYIVKVNAIDSQTKKEELTDISIWDIIHKEEKDVTNELLFDFWIAWDDYKKIWKILFENDILCVNNFDFQLTPWDKIYEFFDLLFRAKYYYNSLTFTYEELKELVRNKKEKYEKLQMYEINKDSINDIVWKKLRNIKEKTWMKDRILDFSDKEISIRQETAS